MRVSFAWPALVFAAVSACGQIFVGVGPDASEDAGVVAEDAPSLAPDVGTTSDASDASVEERDALPATDALLPLLYRVFVTSEVFDGAPGVGGRGAADAVCGVAAARLVGSRRWLAYLAVPGSHAGSRLVDVGGWVLVDGKTAVTNRLALLAGLPLQHAINVTETGSTLGIFDPSSAWTGMSNNNPATSNHCGQWGNGSLNANGRIGNARQTDMTWQSADNSICSNKHRFYCFEQP